MNRDELFSAMGDISEESREEAVGFLYGEEPRRAGGKKAVRVRRKAVRTLLIAAVIASLLSVGAFAVWKSAMASRTVETLPVSGLADEEQESATPQKNISFFGDSESPASKAWVEWTNYVNGVDTSALDNSCMPKPYLFYSVYNDDMAAKLDEIMAEYGLKLHQEMTTFESADELYQALGTPKFLSGIHASGYIYDDGSFNAQGDYSSAEMVSGYYFFVNMNGYFTDVSMSLADKWWGQYQEWSYETASGLTVDIVLGTHRSMIITDLGSAAVTCIVYNGSEGSEYYEPGTEHPEPLPISREYLESLADAINFAALSERYPG